MLQGVGVQLGQYAVERPALSPQTVHFLQQLQEMGQRIEALERRSAKLETGRPVQRAGLATVGIDRQRWARLRGRRQADLDHADVVARLTTKVPKRLLDILEQGVGLTIGGKYLLQPLHTKQLVIGVAGIDHPVGQQEYPITRG